MVYKIGITGGIASGKSRCLQFLSTLTTPRIYTINLDLFADKIYIKNPYALRNIKTMFGEETVKSDIYGHNVGVNRPKLG